MGECGFHCSLCKGSGGVQVHIRGGEVHRTVPTRGFHHSLNTDQVFTQRAGGIKADPAFLVNIRAEYRGKEADLGAVGLAIDSQEEQAAFIR